MLPGACLPLNKNNNMEERLLTVSTQATSLFSVPGTMYADLGIRNTVNFSNWWQYESLTRGWAIWPIYQHLVQRWLIPAIVCCYFNGLPPKNECEPLFSHDSKASKPSTTVTLHTHRAEGETVCKDRIFSHPTWKIIGLFKLIQSWWLLEKWKDQKGLVSFCSVKFECVFLPLGNKVIKLSSRELVECSELAAHIRFPCEIIAIVGYRAPISPNPIPHWPILTISNELNSISYNFTEISCKNQWNHK